MEGTEKLFSFNMLVIARGNDLACVSKKMRRPE
jgi:hypothetical protein